MSTFIDPVTGSQVTVADSKDARFAHSRRLPGSEGVADVGLLETTRREAEERAARAASEMAN